MPGKNHFGMQFADRGTEVGGNMLKENTTVSIYANPDQVYTALVKLKKSGFDLKRISVIGKAYADQNELVAYYRKGEKLKCWGERSEFWNGLSTMIQEWALFSCSGAGLLLVIGPIAVWVVAVLNNSAIFVGLSALGGTLYSMGLARERVQDCEEALRRGNYLLIVHGPAQEVIKAKRVLQSANTMHTKEYIKKNKEEWS